MEFFKAITFFEYLGLDKNMRMSTKTVLIGMPVQNFVLNMTKIHFDPDYDNMALEDFEPMVRKSLFQDQEIQSIRKEITLKNPFYLWIE